MKVQMKTMTMTERRIPAEPGPPTLLRCSLAFVSFVFAYRGSASLASVFSGLMMGADHGPSGWEVFSVRFGLAGLARMIIWSDSLFFCSVSIEHYRETGSRQDTPIIVTS